MSKLSNEDIKRWQDVEDAENAVLEDEAEYRENIIALMEALEASEYE